jgi:hypothetical protein
MDVNPRYKAFIVHKYQVSAVPVPSPVRFQSNTFLTIISNPPSEVTGFKIPATKPVIIKQK